MVITYETKYVQFSRSSHRSLFDIPFSDKIMCVLRLFWTELTGDDVQEEKRAEA